MPFIHYVRQEKQRPMTNDINCLFKAMTYFDVRANIHLIIWRNKMLFKDHMPK